MSDRRQRAAQLIAEARLKPATLLKLPADLVPQDQDEAYRIQALLRGELVKRGLGDHVGWKVGSTTAAMQKLLGVPAPAAGAILSSNVHRSPASLSHGRFRRVGLECEVAVELAADLAPEGGAPVGRAQAEAAVARLHPAIEIVDDRYGDFVATGAPTMIADDFFQAAIVLGPAVERWQGLDLAAAGGVTRVNGKEVQRGRGADVLGHPLNSLVWLANRLAEVGERLKVGQIVMTGSLTLPYWAAKGERIEIEIAGLGQAAVHLE